MEIRLSDDIRAALNVGTTLTTRFWLALAMLLYGAGFLLKEGSWLLSPSFQAMNEIVHLHYWGVLFLVGGVLAMWRVFAPRARTYVAWGVNSLVFCTWMVVVLVRFWGLGSFSVLSVHTAFMLMAAWCLVRTEATSRDRETA